MPVVKGQKLPPHSAEEKVWANEKIASGIINMKAIDENKLAEEMESKFGRKVSTKGIYSWFRYIKNPGLKKAEYRNRKNKMEPKESKGNAKFLREKETFEKSDVLAYVNHNIIGFENQEALKEFLMKNQVIGNDVVVFKKTPIKIEYKIVIGAE